MSIRICDHCGKPVEDDAVLCPHCGAEIGEEIRLTKIPETIEELQAFCAAHHMPLEKMRFFIGEDYKGARAFGIYKDENGDCVVYKNKADGSRAVRYRGPDEKHAVRELYEKLKSETELRRGGSGDDSSRSADAGEDEPLKPWEAVLGAIFLLWKPLLIAACAVLLIVSSLHKPHRGYYRYQDDTYYYQNDNWYYYDTAFDDWTYLERAPEELRENYGSFYDGKNYDSSAYDAESFEDSGYYKSAWDNFFDSDSSYDDYDWDSWDSSDSSGWDSWDSSDTDWDSDW